MAGKSSPSIYWCWKSNSDPFSKPNKSKWTKFSDIENEIIEDAHQRKEEEVIFDTFRINLKQKIRICKSNPESQRPVSRKNNDPNEDYTIRESRFNVIDLPIKTFTDASGISRMISQWSKEYNDSCCTLLESNVSKIIEHAAIGIVKEGALMNKSVEAAWIAKQLHEVKYQSLNAIGECCISYYTKESFLYHVLNDALRRENLSKIETLGPYCFLLVSALRLRRDTNRYTQRVYRGCKLTKQQIEQYVDGIGKVRSWAAFSSTTKKLAEVKQFGNTLFVIDLTERPFTESFGLDISSLSKYPHEEEVLLPAGINFVVEKVDYNQNQDRYTIYLTT